MQDHACFWKNETISKIKIFFPKWSIVKKFRMLLFLYNHQKNLQKRMLIYFKKPFLIFPQDILSLRHTYIFLDLKISLKRNVRTKTGFWKPTLSLEVNPDPDRSIHNKTNHWTFRTSKAKIKWFDREGNSSNNSPTPSANFNPGTESWSVQLQDIEQLIFLLLLPMRTWAPAGC